MRRTPGSCRFPGARKQRKISKRLERWSRAWRQDPRVSKVLPSMGLSSRRKTLPARSTQSRLDEVLPGGAGCRAREIPARHVHRLGETVGSNDCVSLFADVEEEKGVREKAAAWRKAVEPTRGLNCGARSINGKSASNPNSRSDP